MNNIMIAAEMAQDLKINGKIFRRHILRMFSGRGGDTKGRKSLQPPGELYNNKIMNLVW